MLHILEHTLEHTIEDVIGLLPFLFFTYLVMELLEHFAGSKFSNKIKNAGKYMQEIRNYARTTRGRRYKML